MSNGSLSHEKTPRSRPVTDARLVVIEGRASSKEVPLKLPAVLGRGENVTVLVKDKEKRVSRTHCEITDRDGMLVVHDLNSKNGTFVNGARVTESLLKPNDTLTVGPLTFRVQYTPAPQPVAPRPAPVEKAEPAIVEELAEPAAAVKPANQAISEDEIDFLLNTED
jgi:predicted component of type VI protein secretion system